MTEYLQTLLVFNGVVYAVFYGVTASLSSLFTEIYPFLNQTKIGLCFLAVGGGASCGTVSSGWLLDKEYQAVKRDLVKKAMIQRAEAEKLANPPSSKANDTEHSTENTRKNIIMEVTKEENFPIERARLRTVPFLLIVYAACVIAYGWCLQRKVALAGPLVLQFFSELNLHAVCTDFLITNIVGFIAIAIMNTTQTLIIDLLPAQSSSVTACVRIFFVIQHPLRSN